MQLRAFERYIPLIAVGLLTKLELNDLEGQSK